MKCSNEYCIYNDNLLCVLDNIVLDISGCCEQCILVKINDRELEKMKKKQLQKLEQKVRSI